MIARECELRQLFLNHEVGEGILHGEFIAESQTVVVESEADVHGYRFLVLPCRMLCHLHQQFVVMIKDLGFLTPYGLPGLVEGAGGSASQREIFRQELAACQFES